MTAALLALAVIAGSLLTVWFLAERAITREARDFQRTARDAAMGRHPAGKHLPERQREIAALDTAWKLPTARKEDAT